MAIASPNKHGAIILAAGFSHRFGSDKRLADFNSSTILLASIGSTLNIYDDVVVVLRYEDSLIEEQLASLPVRIVHAPKQPIGLGVSIATGINVIRNCGCDTASICLGDMPYMAEALHQSLLLHAEPSMIVRPVFNQQPGHPVIFGKDFFHFLMKLHGDDGAMKIIKEHPQQLKMIPVSDDAVIRDIDRPGL